eukprot:6639426-Prymnesium_polylepis.1
MKCPLPTAVGNGERRGAPQSSEVCARACGTAHRRRPRRHRSPHPTTTPPPLSRARRHTRPFGQPPPPTRAPTGHARHAPPTG